MAKALDLIGKRFVIERAENNKNGNTMWICQCDCGKTRIALGYDLTHGRTTSCGCNPLGKPNPNRIDLTGKRFGRLQIISLDEEESNNGILYWKCKCDCGKIISVRGGNLKNGSTRSCGCISKEKIRYDDLTGKRYGRLTVIEQSGRIRGEIAWLCQCDCGNRKIIVGNDLKSGTKSCGCLGVESRKRPKRITHGMSKTRLYREWNSLKTRCSENYHARKNYFENGITFCEEWKTFENFRDWAMANGYNEKLSLDRIDNNKGYYPENCRWATMKEQQNNRSDNVIIEYMGESKTLKQWCEYLGLNYGMVKQRRKRGFEVPRLFEPPHKNQYQ